MSPKQLLRSLSHRPVLTWGLLLGLLGVTAVLIAACGGTAVQPASGFVGNPHAYPANQTPEKLNCLACHRDVKPREDDAGVRDQLRDACYACHKDFEQKVASPAPHKVVKEGSCTTCHRFHQTEAADQLRVAPERLCFACHPVGLRGQVFASQHPPYGSGFCTSCHDPHGAQVRPLLRGPKETLCFTCHRKVAQRDLGRKVSHPPFARGLCTACHSPHGTAVKPLLRNEVKELCLSCHEPERLRQTSIAHGTHLPFERGFCITCHNPHSSDFGSLLRSERAQVCGTCHPGQRFVLQ